MDSTNFTHTDFFVVRTPLLPFDDFLKWGENLHAAVSIDDPTALREAIAADRAYLRHYLMATFERSEVREALFLSSPSLVRSLAGGVEHDTDKRTRGIQLSLVRYFSRMTGRSTPFGLMAGHSVGRIDRQTELTLPPLKMYVRRTRLALSYVNSFVDQIQSHPSIQGVLKYHPNSSLYRLGTTYRYLERQYLEETQPLSLVAVERNQYLDLVLETARGGVTSQEIAHSLTALDSDITTEEASQFVEELVTHQILISDISPPVTGIEPLNHLIGYAKSVALRDDITSDIEHIHRQISGLNATGLGSDAHVYEAIMRRLQARSPSVKGLPFITDLIKPATNVTLGGEPLTEIMAGVSILHRLSVQRAPSVLSGFRDAFVERYGHREVPLVEALDEDTGIGFHHQFKALEPSPLFDGVNWPSLPSNSHPWYPRSTVLLEKVVDALTTGANEIQLTPEDISKMESPETFPLPDSIFVLATLIGNTNSSMGVGDFRVFIDAIAGPPGTKLFGRACFADPELHDCVRRNLSLEESLAPEAVYAEVVHLPDDAEEAFTGRPVLRTYEIPYLGKSGAPLHRQISITDLRIAVVRGAIVLRSISLGREVIPRLTTAHNFSGRGSGIYSFLCSLQHQNIATAHSWDWGPLATLPFLPRVAVGRLILARARWRIDSQELSTLLIGSDVEWFTKLQRWRFKRRIPRLIRFGSGDKIIPVDLENILSVEAFLHEAKQKHEVIITEMLPGPDQLVVQGPEGHFAHEIILPLITTRRPNLSRTAAIFPDHQTSTTRTFLPGSEWLFVKLYSGKAFVDPLLRTIIGPVANRFRITGAVECWHFVRYRDPAPHLRVRFRGKPEVLLHELLPALTAAIQPLVSQGIVGYLQLDTYEREIERYGGPDAIGYAEQIFYADSAAVLDILSVLTGDDGLEMRPWIALCGIDRLLEDFQLDTTVRLNMLTHLEQNLAIEFGIEGQVKQHLATIYRNGRQRVESMLHATRVGSEEGSLGIQPLWHRSVQIQSVIANLQQLERDNRLLISIPKLTASFVHMHVNRLLRAEQRRQELVLYHFLRRTYESELARSLVMA